jgi:hypothetical protein
MYIRQFVLWNAKCLKCFMSELVLGSVSLRKVIGSLVQFGAYKSTIFIVADVPFLIELN